MTPYEYTSDLSVTLPLDAYSGARYLKEISIYVGWKHVSLNAIHGYGYPNEFVNDKLIMLKNMSLNVHKTQKARERNVN